MYKPPTDSVKEYRIQARKKIIFCIRENYGFRSCIKVLKRELWKKYLAKNFSCRRQNSMFVMYTGSSLWQLEALSILAIIKGWGWSQIQHEECLLTPVLWGKICTCNL
jgi:hypothetical protein